RLVVFAIVCEADAKRSLADGSLTPRGASVVGLLCEHLENERGILNAAGCDRGMRQPSDRVVRPLLTFKDPFHVDRVVRPLVTDDPTAGGRQAARADGVCVERGITQAARDGDSRAA